MSQGIKPPNSPQSLTAWRSVTAFVFKAGKQMPPL
jgi:hypothetical protein